MNRSPRAKKLKFELLAACGLALTALCTIGAGTYAWFSLNHYSMAKINEIRVHSDEAVAKINYHNIYSVVDENGGTVFNFSKAESANKSIGEYSRALEAPEHQLLIDVVVNSNINDLEVLATAKNDILEGGHSWSTVDWASTGNPLSSIVTIATYTEDEVTVGEYYTLNKKASKSFVTLDEFSTPTFSTQIDLIETLSSSASARHIYFVLDYNLDAIDSIYSANIGNEVFESEEANENGLKFQCDFAIEVDPK